MIQRIQTIFLLLASVAGFGVLALPFATTSDVVQGSEMFADKTYNIGDNIGLLVFFVVAGALALASIFLFNNRQVQLKLGKIALTAEILGVVLAIVLFLQERAALGSSTVNDGLGIYLPLAYILFVVLAVRAINKDEALVKSADRLR